MITNPRKFFAGLLALALFALVLALFFLPVLDGQSPMIYLDSLYNSISKQSAYYIPALKEEAAGCSGHELHLTVTMNDAVEAEQAASMLSIAGVAAHATGAEIELRGDLSDILQACLDDSDLMFANNGAALEARYGLQGRKVLFRWWQILKLMDKGLKKERRFEDAKIVSHVNAKGLESAYNYFGIEPVHIREKAGAVILSLLFYVLYTIWYGYAIIFIFEGCGLKLSH